MYRFRVMGETFGLCHVGGNAPKRRSVVSSLPKHGHDPCIGGAQIKKCTKLPLMGVLIAQIEKCTNANGYGSR